MHYDALIQVKNAQMAKKETVLVPFSRLNFAILKTLVDTKFLKDAQKKSAGRRTFIEVKLAYEAGAPKIQTVKIMSKPGKRVYTPYAELKPVRQGYGIGVLSTSKGVMSNREAKKQKVGGEYLVQVW